MKFYNFVNKATEVDLYINGEIVADQDKEFLEMWGYDCFAPTDFKEQLAECNGKPINVYIDSYGGDVLAASSIYTMLREYKGAKTVKIGSIAASAASVIAMAGDQILMSPTAFLMIHDPATVVGGNITEVKQGLESLQAVKEGIINAYERKCNLSREQISELMTNETWLDYTKAKEYGFVDGEIGGKLFDTTVLNSIKQRQMSIYNMVKQNTAKSQPQAVEQEPVVESVEQVEDGSQAKIKAQKQRLEFLKLKR